MQLFVLAHDTPFSASSVLLALGVDFTDQTVPFQDPAKVWVAPETL